MKKKIFLLLSIAMVFPCYAQMSSNLSLRFEIIQTQFAFDNSTVNKASLEESNRNFTGIRIQLKPDGAKAFTNMTKANIGKTVNLVFNNKIISSSVIQTELGSDLLVTGISREDAELFLQLLRINEPSK
jgi:preprotein translocase subunit SecD